ncbi:ABC transporter permease [Pseudarthrobacter raffinosi]|uniref:ABC transporter permease n=1 Tax=Pseudarthrobacter raffinosi TaxID=2953651 RepID=UPI00208E18E1|nr:ABC transporter permease [Pseudarthrobacter sp. MDT3-9]MCO4251248.1 ABC transporter permease [Pseudarthrobacter sp. MDT3-9]
MNTVLRSPFLPLLVPIAIIATWWFASAGSTSVFFPSLQDILIAFQETWLFAHFWSDIVPSVVRLIAGYIIACLAGIAVGLLLGRVRSLDAAFQPSVQFARAIPAVALIPVAILLFGIGDVAKIVLIAFCCFFPVLLNTIDGVRNVESGLEDVSRSFRLTRWQRAVSVQLPSAMPQIFAGMQTSLGFAFILGIVTEMTGSANGIGFITLEAQQSFTIDTMWSGMLLLGILGSLLNALFVLIEHRSLRWHYQSKAGH